MGFEVIDGNERFSRRKRQRLGRDEADHDASDQPGAGRGRDGIKVLELQPCLIQSPGDDPVQELDMGASGDFRAHFQIHTVPGSCLATDKLNHTLERLWT